MKQLVNLIRVMYLVLFFSISFAFADLEILGDVNKMALSGILSAVGTVSGFFAYQLVSKKSIYLQYSVLGGFALLFFLWVLFRS